VISKGRRTSKPAQQRRPPLTRERILDAALELVDNDGLQALSMRRLGAELGVEAMSIYHHVPSKAALFDGMVERIWSQALASAPDYADRTDWEGYVRSAARSMRGVLRAHPNSLALVSTRPVATPDALKVVDHVVGVLVRAGFDGSEAVMFMQALATFVIGQALAEVGQSPVEPAAADAESLMERFRAIDPADLPNLIPVLADYEYDADAEFEFGLDLVIAGFGRERR